MRLSKGQKITCHSAEDMEFALGILEVWGYQWINGGEKPTNWLPHEKISGHTFPDSINWHSEGKICRGNYPSGQEWIITV